MTGPSPHYILCAVRSHPGSEQTVKKAVDLALEAGARLTFFQVVDAEFVSQIASGRTSLKIAYEELTNMAEFTMIILCERARRRGVEEVDYVVRQGNVREHLKRIAIETDAEIMVMGAPKRSPGRNVFTPKTFKAFVAELEEIGKVRVVY